MSTEHSPIELEMQVGESWRLAMNFTGKLEVDTNETIVPEPAPTVTFLPDYGAAGNIEITEITFAGPRVKFRCNTADAVRGQQYTLEGTIHTSEGNIKKLDCALVIIG